MQHHFESFLPEPKMFLICIRSLYKIKLQPQHIYISIESLQNAEDKYNKLIQENLTEVV